MERAPDHATWERQQDRERRDRPGQASDLCLSRAAYAQVEAAQLRAVLEVVPGQPRASAAQLRRWACVFERYGIAGAGAPLLTFLRGAADALEGAS